LELSQTNYRKLTALVNSYADEEPNVEFSKDYLNRNITEVLAHLHQWHIMFLDWYAGGMAGKKPDIPAKGYTLKYLPDINRKIQEKYSNSDYKEVRKLLDTSFANVRKNIEKHPENELFEKKIFSWTGTTLL